MGNVKSMENEYEEGVNLGDVFSDSWLRKPICIDKTTVKLYEAGIYEPDFHIILGSGDTLEEAIAQMNKIRDEDRGESMYTPEDIFTGSMLQAKLLPEIQKKVLELEAELKVHKQMLKDIEPEEEMKYINSYECTCGHTWKSTWSCTCNDRCPKCRNEIKPSSSEDIE
jgi:hypothetical protein